MQIAERYQQAHQARSAELASMINYVTESMDWTVGLRSTPPRLQVPQPILATVNRGLTLNTINIDRSVIGMLNAGQIQDVQNISINVSALVESGNSNVAQALKMLTEAVAACQDIPDEQRTELLDQLDELSSQAALPSEKRAKSGVIKAIIASLGAGLSVAGNLAQIWSTWGATISGFFGI